LVTSGTDAALALSRCAMRDYVGEREKANAMIHYELAEAFFAAVGTFFTVIAYYKMGLHDPVSAVWGVVQLPYVQIFLAFVIICQIAQITLSMFGLRLLPCNIEAHDSSYYPDTARRLFITGYQKWSNGNFSFDFMVNLKSVVDEARVSKVLFVAAGSGWDIQLALPRFKVLMPNVKIVVSDLFPHVNEWRKSFGCEPYVDYITESVDACHVRLSEPQVLVLKGAAHHLSYDTMKDMISNAIHNESPLIIYDAASQGILGGCICAVFAVAALPYWMSFHLVNNLRQAWRTNGLAALPRTFLLFCIYLPFLMLSASWDILGPSTSGFSESSYRRILQELGYSSEYMVFTSTPFGHLALLPWYICVVNPNACVGAGLADKMDDFEMRTASSAEK